MTVSKTAEHANLMEQLKRLTPSQIKAVRIYTDFLTWAQDRREVPKAAHEKIQNLALSGVQENNLSALESYIIELKRALHNSGAANAN